MPVVEQKICKHSPAKGDKIYVPDPSAFEVNKVVYIVHATRGTISAYLVNSITTDALVVSPLVATGFKAQADGGQCSVRQVREVVQPQAQVDGMSETPAEFERRMREKTDAIWRRMV